MNQPLVSICSITYNHAPYIRECLDGFLMQKTDFPFEIIIHDDCSTDGTTEIIREYAEKYPDIIIPLYEQENQYSKGVRGIFNKYCYPKTRGKYIAICEGDDYWTDPLKLQKQVDFLESHPDYSLCATNISILFKNALKPSRWNKRRDCDVSTKETIINGGEFLGTLSLLFRQEYLKSIPTEIFKLHVGDYPLQIYLASIGKVRLLSQTTGVYRFMSEGSWTSTNVADFTSIVNVNRYISQEKKLFATMDTLTKFKYHKYFRQREQILCFYICMGLNNYQSRKLFWQAPCTILRYCSFKSIIYANLPNAFKEMYKSLFRK